MIEESGELVRRCRSGVVIERRDPTHILWPRASLVSRPHMAAFEPPELALQQVGRYLPKLSRCRFDDFKDALDHTIDL
jgi:hypothetical protein